MRGARGRMRSDARRIPRRRLHGMIVIVRDADVDADVRALFKIEDDARIFDRFPGSLEQETLLGIDIGGFARRDATLSPPS